MNADLKWVLSLMVHLTLMGWMMTAFSGCAPQWYRDIMNQQGFGGGQDVIVVDMPFDAGYQSQCVQGPGGSYSHHYRSTAHDIDLDTPNNRRDPVYAPVNGTVYTHETKVSTGFGRHANIDVGDGTYIMLGHLDEILVRNGSEVAKGQLIGIEGTTGHSTGDHVHFGRHLGDASLDAGVGESIPGLRVRVQNASVPQGDLPVGSMVCSLMGGTKYVSALATPRWHPDGTLVKTPNDAKTYLLEAGSARWVSNEHVFWSHHYNFADVVVVSDEELDCYPKAGNVNMHGMIRAGVDASGTVWLLLGSATEPNRTRMRVRSAHWQQVLRSWGIYASTHDELLSETELGSSFHGYPIASGFARFRDGTLLKELDRSDVYVVTNGIAMPVKDWDTFVLMGFAGRELLEVPAGAVSGIHGSVGSCEHNVFCISQEDVLTCGGLDTGYGVTVGIASHDSGEPDESPLDTDDHEDGVPEGDSAVDDPDLFVSWSSYGTIFDRLTLSGEFTDANGYSDGWFQRTEVFAENEVGILFPETNSGATFRFSVEFVQNGQVSWSCLAPFPPGTLVGEVKAYYGGVSIPVVPTGDPAGSPGCGLTVTVP